MGSDDILDLGSWCILRMASADTLKVVQSLKGAGFDVWTPTEWQVARMPRTRARYDKPRPIMPSYAFARVEHLDELLRTAMLPTRQGPRFTVFHYGQGVPVVADRGLEGLRHQERQLREKFERARFKGLKLAALEPGTEVQMPAGAFEGLSGIVEDTQGQFTLVNVDVFGKTTLIKVASLLLADAEAVEQAKAA